MRHEEIRELLDDLVDGSLAPGAGEAIEAHLADCETCAAVVSALRALLSDAAALPRSVEPPRDLWPRLSPRLGRGPLRHRVFRSQRMALAAAAILLVIVTASVTTLVVREGPPTVYDVAADWVAAEAAYVGAVRELEEALAGAMADLAPETAALIQDNLRVIDEAIRESRAALAADPGNRDVLPFLASMYEKKLDVLQQISRSSSL